MPACSVHLLAFSVIASSNVWLLAENTRKSGRSRMRRVVGLVERTVALRTLF